MAHVGLLHYAIANGRQLAHSNEFTIKFCGLLSLYLFLALWENYVNIGQV